VTKAQNFNCFHSFDFGDVGTVQELGCVRQNGENLVECQQKWVVVGSRVEGQHNNIAH
jgi:hypothetical protein